VLYAKKGIWRGFIASIEGENIGYTRYFFIEEGLIKRTVGG
jgi:hypothetical protein